MINGITCSESVYRDNALSRWKIISKFMFRLIKLHIMLMRSTAFDAVTTTEDRMHIYVLSVDLVSMIRKTREIMDWDMFPRDMYWDRHANSRELASCLGDILKTCNTPTHRVTTAEITSLIQYSCHGVLLWAFECWVAIESFLEPDFDCDDLLNSSVDVETRAIVERS